MNRMDNIISSISVHINMSFRKRHDSSWAEHKIKTEYTLWSIMEGNVYIKTGGKEYAAHKGDAVLFYPETDYHANTDEGGCDFVVVRFALEMGNSIDLFAGLNLSGIATGITDKTLVFCDKFMQNHKFAKRTSFKQYAMFIDYISDVIEIQNSDKSVLFYKHAEKVDRSSIQRAIDYISKNYSTIHPFNFAKKSKEGGGGLRQYELTRLYDRFPPNKKNILRFLLSLECHVNFNFICVQF